MCVRACVRACACACACVGAKDDWDFRISDLVKGPDGTDIITPVMNFGEVRRAQLAKFALLTSTLVPLGLSDFLNSVQMIKEEWGA